MAGGDNVTQLRGRLCPIRGKPATLDHRPFCSARCRDLDLWRWFRGGYRLPTEEPMSAGDLDPEEEPE